jgi:hypothetical protein
MAKLLHLKEIHDLENDRSGAIIQENHNMRTVEPRSFPLGQNSVDELTLWTIAKQIENGAKDSNSK